MTASDIRVRMTQLIEQLCQGLYEREEPVKLALLSTVAGESIFLLGPPGVGKSLIARRLKFAFRDGTSFEYLMSKFSTPDEIFGPVSIRKLKEEDRYERLTDRYLPGANIVFLDEIWKSGSAIQNALLTILNEKVYRNGEQEVRVDIKGIITASNELPPEGEGFLPLWDRFLVRYEMGNVREQRNFLNMITDTQDVYADDLEESVKFTQTELAQWDQEIDQVEVPPEVLNTIQVIRANIQAYNEKPNRETEPIRIFDRRWKKLVRLLRTAAFMHGRKEVNLMDCFLAVHCLWSHPSQKAIL
ncbi:MAG: AAA family ATPase, partial [Bacteroidota bacterium]